jgi:hypothetical protein
MSIRRMVVSLLMWLPGVLRIFTRTSTQLAPYHKKDLDEDLACYFTECVREIGRADFMIRFMFECFPSQEFMQRVRTSVHKFFIYQRELELAAMNKLLRTAFTLLIIGIFILGLSLWLNHLFALDGSPSFLNTVFAEGLTIVKIAEAPVQFQQPSETLSGGPEAPAAKPSI